MISIISSSNLVFVFFESFFKKRMIIFNDIFFMKSRINRTSREISRFLTEIEKIVSCKRFSKDLKELMLLLNLNRAQLSSYIVKQVLGCEFGTNSKGSLHNYLISSKLCEHICNICIL